MSGTRSMARLNQGICMDLGSARTLSAMSDTESDDEYEPSTASCPPPLHINTPSFDLSTLEGVKVTDVGTPCSVATEASGNPNAGGEDDGDESGGLTLWRFRGTSCHVLLT